MILVLGGETHFLNLVREVERRDGNYTVLTVIRPVSILVASTMKLVLVLTVLAIVAVLAVLAVLAIVATLMVLTIVVILTPAVEDPIVVPTSTVIVARLVSAVSFIASLVGMLTLRALGGLQLEIRWEYRTILDLAVLKVSLQGVAVDRVVIDTVTVRAFQR